MLLVRILFFITVVKHGKEDVIPGKDADNRLMNKLRHVLMEDNADYDSSTGTTTESTIPTISSSTTILTIKCLTAWTRPQYYTPSYLRNRFKIVSPTDQPTPTSEKRPIYRGLKPNPLNKYPIFRDKNQKGHSVHLDSTNFQKHKKERKHNGIDMFKVEDTDPITEKPLNLNNKVKHAKVKHQTTYEPNINFKNGPVFRVFDETDLELEDALEIKEDNITLSTKKNTPAVQFRAYRYVPTMKPTTVAELKTFLTLPDSRHNLKGKHQKHGHKRASTDGNKPSNDHKSIHKTAKHNHTDKQNKEKRKDSKTQTIEKDNVDLESALKKAVSRALSRVEDNKKQSYEFHFNSSVRRADYLRWKYAQGVV